MKRREVVYAPDAGDDLAWIYGTIAAAATPVTAHRYERRIRDFCEGLSYASARGSPRDDVRSGLRVVGFERRVTIAFTVEPARVVILRIFYGGADWTQELKS